MTLGIVGAGQLARMLLEDASALGVDCVVLAESPDDGAAKACANVILGSPHDEAAMRSLVNACDVVTFDHELVDLALLARLEAEGAVFRPSPTSLVLAVDKAAMRRALDGAGLPIPAFSIIAPEDEGDLVGFGARQGWPIMIKAARGGYDGRGVFVAEDLMSARTIVDDLHRQGITALLEAMVPIRAELAALVARRPTGEVASWPVVETAQLAGVCREVLVPGAIDSATAAAAAALAIEIAELSGVEGVMAVELFDTEDGLFINELAMRPHNSGHWTQDGSTTSQFENHLRAVLDLPLGDTGTIADAVASVNIFGGDSPREAHEALSAALSVGGAHVHLYGKTDRPGRKLGHVNVVGHNGAEVRKMAWRAAAALGTPVPDELSEGVR
jgi:5-(carboxyamino)imidazole ribonucleotide synthase